MSERQLVVFSLGEERYGAEISRVREIIIMQHVTPVPQAPDYVKGMINLRGTVIPVVDLRQRIGLPTKPVDDATRILVTEMRTGLVGCIVDSVDEVRTISDSQVIPPTDAVGVSSAYVDGIVQTDNHLVLLLNLHEFI